MTSPGALPAGGLTGMFSPQTQGKPTAGTPVLPPAGATKQEDGRLLCRLSVAAVFLILAATCAQGQSQTITPFPAGPPYYMPFATVGGKQRGY